MSNKGVVNANYAGIPVGVCVWLLFLRKNHNICMGTGVEGILLSSHVVGSVIDPHNFVLIDLVLDESNSCTFGFGKRDLVEIIFLVENLTKSEVFEARDEILY